MSQKIIIPKGAIDSNQINIIEIPAYLQEAATVVIATPRKADLATLQEAWNLNNPVAEDVHVEQSDDNNWEQEEEAAEEKDDPEQQEQFPEEQYEYQEQQYASPASDEDVNNEQQVEYQEEGPKQPSPRRPKHQLEYAAEMKRRMREKRRELQELKAERRRILEGDTGTYETAQPQEAQMNYIEGPGDMKPRRNPSYDAEKRNMLQEFERYQQQQSQGYRYQQSSQPPQQFYRGCAANRQGIPNPQVYANNQTAQYGYQDQMQATGSQFRGQAPSPQMDFTRENMGQYVRARRPVPNAPRNY